jgi:hypothetical protein
MASDFPVLSRSIRPEFGLQHFKGYDFLRDKEVVLTFDDGPWPGSTAAVLKALADQCVKATFFEIGKHATSALTMSEGSSALPLGPAWLTELTVIFGAVADIL